MGLYRHVHTLLEVSTATTANETGQPHVILPSDTDRTEDSEQSFRAFIDLTQTGGSTSPSVSVQLQTSHDGASWVDAITPIQNTAEGSSHHFVTVEALGPFVRARTTVSGNPKPTHLAKVLLSSNANFRVKQVVVPGPVDAAVRATPA